MKGYTINNVLYVFDANPAAIPSVGASVTTIYVQQEQLDAWKTANESYASLIQPYNYKLLSVQPKVWADYTNEDVPVPHDVTISGDNVVTTDATDLLEGDIFKFKPATNYYISSASAVSGEDAVTITDLVDDPDGYTKSFVMPDGDVTLTVSTALIPYDVTVSGDNVVTTETNDVTPGTTFKFKPATGYNLTSASAVCGEDAVTITDLVDDPDGYTKSFTMPYGDVTLTVVTELITYDVTVSGSNVVTTQTNDLIPGTTFKFKAATGYNLIRYSADYGETGWVEIYDLVDDPDGYTKAFDMPADDVTLTVSTSYVWDE